MTKQAKKKKLESKTTLISATIVIVLISILAGGFSGYFFSGKFLNKKLEEQRNANSDNKITFDQNNSSTILEDQAIVQVVKKNSPAVVSITVTKEVSQIDTFFSDPFFKQFNFELQEQESKKEFQEIGGGTGFIVDSEGYIITNKHVVEDSKAQYTVSLDSGENYEAEVLAKDSFWDIAILKINKNNLPTVKLGDSDNLNIGQTVIAIGNSLGEFDNSVSKGIISGLKRQIQTGNSFGKTESLDEVIQTDAAINSGNSGGPLFDIYGNVIGINVAMAQGAENIGFTIPINQVKDIYQSVKEHGRIVRPYIGVRYVLINEKIQEANNLLVDHGAIIVRGGSKTEQAIITGSPAEKAGLKEYDIILEIDEEEINSENTLAKIIRKKKVGQTITLKVLSEGIEKNTSLILEESKE